MATTAKDRTAALGSFQVLGCEQRLETAYLHRSASEKWTLRCPSRILLKAAVKYVVLVPATVNEPDGRSLPGDRAVHQWRPSAPTQGSINEYDYHHARIDFPGWWPLLAELPKSLHPRPAACYPRPNRSIESRGPCLRKHKKVSTPVKRSSD